MDLSKFDTREKATAGIEAPLTINGEVIYGDDDQPVTFRTKGIADPDVHAALLKIVDGKNRTAKEAAEFDLKLARIAIVGWSGNFEVEGEKLEYSKANIDKICANPVVRKAVLSPVFDEQSFMNGS